MHLTCKCLKSTFHTKLHNLFRAFGEFSLRVLYTNLGNDSTSFPSRRFEISCLHESKLWSTFTRGNGRICNAAEVQRRKVIFVRGCSFSIRFSLSRAESHESYRYRRLVPVTDRQMFARIEEIPSKFSSITNGEMLAGVPQSALGNAE